MGPALAAAMEFWRTPECRRLVSIVTFLSSVSGGFWLLAKVVGAVFNLLEDLFFEELWAALATVYNIVLAIAFSAALFAAAWKGADPSQLFLREGCGLVLLYLVLSASYTDPQDGAIDEHARPGWAMGLVSYIFFAAVPRIIDQPRLHELIAVMKEVSDSPVGKVSTLLVAGAFAWRLAKGGMVSLFGAMAPLMWKIGLLKHPPIRVRAPR